PRSAGAGLAAAAAGHPGALLPAGVAQESQGFASNQLMLTARRSQDNDGLDWLGRHRTPRPRVGSSPAGAGPAGALTPQA
ncbi:molybdate ABC transporter substrate-binding protein, partial [Klebsiella pneumoniae]|nr:molybdate ABC transporter substrate-binding protein [Klebsiella pneumoniae]